MNFLDLILQKSRQYFLKSKQKLKYYLNLLIMKAYEKVTIRIFIFSYKIISKMETNYFQIL
jgi:hypothetical protein